MVKINKNIKNYKNKLDYHRSQIIKYVDLLIYNNNPMWQIIVNSCWSELMNDVIYISLEDNTYKFRNLLVQQNKLEFDIKTNSIHEELLIFHYRMLFIIQIPV